MWGKPRDEVFDTRPIVLVCRFKVDMSAFPVISRIQSTLSELEAFKKAHPSQQPDCPPDLK